MRTTASVWFKRCWQAYLLTVLARGWWWGVSWNYHCRQNNELIFRPFPDRRCISAASRVCYKQPVEMVTHSLKKLLKSVPVRRNKGPPWQIWVAIPVSARYSGGPLFRRVRVWIRVRIRVWVSLVNLLWRTATKFGAFPNAFMTSHRCVYAGALETWQIKLSTRKSLCLRNETVWLPCWNARRRTIGAAATPTMPFDFLQLSVRKSVIIDRSCGNSEPSSCAPRCAANQMSISNDHPSKVGDQIDSINSLVVNYTLTIGLSVYHYFIDFEFLPLKI